MIHNCNHANDRYSSQNMVPRIDYHIAEQKIRGKQIINTADLMASFKDSYLNLYGSIMEYKDNERIEQEASAV